MNTSEEALNAYNRLLGYKQEIDSSAAQILEGNQLFGSVSINFTLDSMSECRFQRFVSWLYTLYWESGKKSDIKFLVTLFDTFKLDENKNLTNHFYLVQSLRTTLQHNIVGEDSSSIRIQRICSKWFESVCGLPQPKGDSDWNTCLDKLFDDSQSFFKAILECIGAIENDESKNEIICQWNMRRKRYFSPGDYDNLIREIIGDLGIEKDVVRLRDRHQGKWNEFLKNLSIDSDFMVEIKKLILNTLLDSQDILMPLTTDDIISELNIESGSQEIFKLLAKAKKIYRDNPELAKAELLECLKTDL